MKVTALVDRFGSNRMNAAEPGKLLRGCTCIAVPCAGGMCEIPHMTANIILVNDLDRHVINLCNVLREHRAAMVQWLDGTPYHPDQLKESQEFCKQAESFTWGHFEPALALPWACHYFVASWLTRGGSGGTKGEFEQSMSIRWKSGGGDSVVRFRNATEGLAAWEQVMRRCTFTTLDLYDFLAECLKRDIPENGIYLDRDWPDDGDGYKHNAGSHEKTRDALMAFKQTRLVVRYGDHPLIRELYPESLWAWHRLESRTQANKAKAEALLTRNV